MPYLHDAVVYLENHSGLFVATSSIVGIICGIIGAWLQYRKTRKQRNLLQERIDELNHDLGSAREKVRIQESKAFDLSNKLASTEQQLNAERAGHREKVVQLSQEIEQQREGIDDLETLQRRQKNVIRRMMKLEGQLWEKRPLTSIPKFKPLRDRQTPVFSVLNLKGGVGKTTVTAHLARAFAARGYRVLLLDLDLQGSLTSQFLEQTIISERFEEKKLLQHFLTLAAHKRAINLNDFIVPFLQNAESGIVPTTDRMAYAEMNLTLTWLLQLGQRDSRYLLRRALQQKRITNRFDIILLDCPPIINTCCMNALIASDYVLIPTLPSLKSLERIPQLLVSLKKIAGKLNPSLVVAGAILNRTRVTALSGHERDSWNQMLDRGLDALGIPLHGFETNIREHLKEIREFEVAGSSSDVEVDDSELHETFCELVAEIEERIPRDCRRTADAAG